jgi:hypothetical protein
LRFSIAPQRSARRSQQKSPAAAAMPWRMGSMSPSVLRSRLPSPRRGEGSCRDRPHRQTSCCAVSDLRGEHGLPRFPDTRLGDRSGACRGPCTQFAGWRNAATHDSCPELGESLGQFRKFFQPTSASALMEVSPSELTAGGRGMATILFPDQVIGLLMRSLARVGPDNGLRVRLCLDGLLSDLPWEYLILPDVAGLKSPDSFLALDARVSLVREPPQPGRQRPTLRKKRRLLFYGTRLCSANGLDLWRTAEEKNLLFKALEPASTFLETRSVLSNEINCQTALMRSSTPVDIFHYSGHTDVENGMGYLLASDVHPGGQDAARLHADALGSLLRRAGTTVAVFSACNSGSWAFVGPLLHSEVPVVVGAQGLVEVRVATAFCQQLYSALAIGLSLDEAVTWARLHLLEPGVLPESLRWQWGSFMVYMQTPEAVLFPPPRKSQVAEQQSAARHARQVTIVNVTQQIGSVQGGEVVGVSAGAIGTRMPNGEAQGGGAETDD